MAFDRKYTWMRAVIAVCALCLSAPVMAEQAVGPLTILQPWARATAPGAQTGVIYLGVTNNGTAPDRLVAVSTDLADMAQIHESKIGAGAVMSMDAMRGGVAIPPGQTVVLKPGGMHVMLMGLRQPLKIGDAVPLTLTFEKAGKVAAIAKVAGPGATTTPKD